MSSPQENSNSEEGTASVTSPLLRALQAFQEVAAVGGNAVAQGEVLRTAVGRLLDILGEKAGGICLLREDKSAWQIFSPVSEGVLQMLFCNAEGRKFFAKAVSRPGVSTLTGTKDFSILGRCYSLIASPVRSPEQVFGVVVILSTKERGLPIEDENLLETVGYFLGTCLQNSELVSRSQGSELPYRAVLENVDEILFELDTSGCFTSLSRKVFDSIGYEPEELLGSGFQQIIHSEDLGVPRTAFQDCLKGRSTKTSGFYRVKHKDGDYRWHFSSYAPLKDETGKIIGAMGIARDVTAEVDTQGKLKISETRLKEIFETIPESVVVTDTKGKIVDINRVALEFLGLKPEESEELSIYDFISPEDADKIEETKNAVLKRGRISDLELTLIAEEGTKLPLEMNISLLKSEFGQPLGFLWVGRPLSEERGSQTSSEELEVKLRQSEEKLQELERESQESKEKLQDSEKKLQEWEARSRESEPKLEQSEVKLRQTEERLQESEGRLRKWEEKLEESERSLQELEERSRRSEARLQHSYQTLRELEGKVHEWEVNSGELKGKLRQSEERLQESQARSRELEEKSRREEGKLRKSEGKLGKWEAKLREREEKLQESEAELRQRQGKLRGSEKKLNGMEEKLRESEARSQQLVEELRESRESLQDWEANLRQSQEELAQWKGRLQGSQGKLQESEEKLRHSEANSHQLNEKLQGLEERSREWEEKSRQSETQLQELQRSIQESEKNFRNREAKLRKLEMKSGESEKRLRQAKAESEQLRGKLRESEEKLQESENSLRDWEVRSEEREAKLRQSEGEVQRLEAKSQKSEETLREQEESLRQSQEKLGELEGKLEESEANLRQWSAELQRSRAESQQWELSLRELKGKLQESEKKLRESEAKSRQAGGKLQQAGGKLRQSEGKVQELEGRLQESEAKSDELQLKLREWEVKSEELKEKLKESEVKLGDSEERLTRSEKSLQELQEKLQQSEDRLQQSEQKYLNIFNAVPASLILLDAHGTVVDVNEWHLSHFEPPGTSREDLLGKDFSNYPPNLKMGLSRKLAELLEGRPFEARNLSLPLGGAGAKRVFDVVGVPRFDLDGEIVGGLLVYLDISQRRELEREALEARKLVAVRDLASSIAHELSQPIQGLMALGEMTTPGKVEDKHWELVAAITEWLYDLVQGLKHSYLSEGQDQSPPAE